MFWQVLLALISLLLPFFRSSRSHHSQDKHNSMFCLRAFFFLKFSFLHDQFENGLVCASKKGPPLLAPLRLRFGCCVSCLFYVIFYIFISGWVFIYLLSLGFSCNHRNERLLFCSISFRFPSLPFHPRVQVTASLPDKASGRSSSLRLGQHGSIATLF